MGLQGGVTVAAGAPIKLDEQTLTGLVQKTNVENNPAEVRIRI